MVRFTSLRLLAFLTVFLHASIGTAQYLIANDSALLTGALLYYVAAAGLLACFGAVIHSVGETPSRRDWLVIVGVPVLVQIGWLISHPVLSIDAYSYLVDAAHLHAGLNPYQHAVNEAGGTALGRELAAYGWRPSVGVSPYGPVWMNLVRAVGPFAEDVAIAVRLVKLIACSATALTAWLIFRAAPASFRARAFTVFWWNPVVIIEGAGEGHNDAFMVVAVVLSLWCLRRQAVIAAAAALTAAVLTKWIPAFFAPAYLAYAWRNRLFTWRTVFGGGAVIAAVTGAAYWTLWDGANTFAGVRRVGGPRFVASATGGFLPILADYPTAYALLRVCAACAMAVAMIYAIGTTRTMRDLVRTCAAIALTFVLVAAPVYWPWYVVMPIALLALAGDFSLIIMLTATSRIVAPLNLIRLQGGFSLTTEVWLTTVIALWLPLAYIAWLSAARRLSARPDGISRSWR
jgi:alpha-1,6-mannosyltransferase